MAEAVDDALTKRARAQLGRVLKQKYRLDALLGVGGMASVFAARHRNGNRVAVKLLHPELMLNMEALSRFLREGYAANKVEHRGTVRVLDDDNEGGEAFLVMELLEGETVAALWEREGHSLDAQRLLTIADQALDVLAAAHDKGIVHRDIKPENLFLTREGLLKVLDFGIARVRESTTGVTVTKTGNPFGSPAYMAPEQALGRSREVDARVDIYGLGATMFSLLSGEFVHDAESAHEMVIVTATTPARSLSTVRVRVPPAVVDLVDRAIAFDRSARWPDARSMRQAVRETYASLFGAPLPVAAYPVGAESGSSADPVSGWNRSPGLPSPSEEVSATGPTAPVARLAAPVPPPSSLEATRVKPVGPPTPEVMTAPPTSTAGPVPRSRRLFARIRGPLAASVAAAVILGTILAVALRHAPSQDASGSAAILSSRCSGRSCGQCPKRQP